MAPDVDENVISDSDEGDSEMAEPVDRFSVLMDGEMAMIGQSGRVAQNNFITVAKFADYDYLSEKGKMNLRESLGAREVMDKGQRGPVKAS